MPRYEIRVAGPVGAAALTRLPGFTAERAPGGTMITGRMARPATLATVLAVLDDLDIDALEVLVRPSASPQDRSG